MIIFLLSSSSVLVLYGIIISLCFGNCDSDSLRMVLLNHSCGIPLFLDHPPATLTLVKPLCCILLIPPGQMAPKEGARILVLRAHWLELILSGAKTMEVRCRRLQPGPCLLGSGGQIFGEAEIGPGLRISTAAEWRSLRAEHRVETDEPPYAKTWALPVVNVTRFERTVAYRHPRGAVGIVKYRPR